MCTRRTSAAQRGQSTVEYLMVIIAVMGGLVLTSRMDTLAANIRAYFSDYSYAISIAQVPDCVNTYGGSVGPVSGTVTADNCPDLTNPTWPISNVSVDWDQ